MSGVPADDSRSRDACPLCGSSSWSAGRLSDPETRGCNACGLVYRVIPVRPTYAGERPLQALEAIDRARASMFEGLLRRLGGPAPGDVLADIGAGSGAFAARARTAGWRAVGLELDRSPASTGRRLGRPLVVADAEALPLPSATAAVITLWDVLDHFDSPRRALVETARVLRPGGILWLRLRHGTVHEMMRSCAWLPRNMSVLHNNLFSPRCLRTVLREIGFDDVEVTLSPTTRGNPYRMSGVRALLLTTAKWLWDRTARLVAAASRDRMILSPSISVRARRAGAPDHA